MKEVKDTALLCAAFSFTSFKSFTSSPSSAGCRAC